jgi:hypothetical protein
MMRGCLHGYIAKIKKPLDPVSLLAISVSRGQLQTSIANYFFGAKLPGNPKIPRAAMVQQMPNGLQ